MNAPLDTRYVAHWVLYIAHFTLTFQVYTTLILQCEQIRFANRKSTLMYRVAAPILESTPSNLHFVMGLLAPWGTGNPDELSLLPSTGDFFKLPILVQQIGPMGHRQPT